jgi:hypothetical protein
MVAFVAHTTSAARAHGRKQAADRECDKKGERGMINAHPRMIPLEPEPVSFLIEPADLKAIHSRDCPTRPKRKAPQVIAS